MRKNTITCKRASKIIAANGVDSITFTYSNFRVSDTRYHSDNIVVLDNCIRKVALLNPRIVKGTNPGDVMYLIHKKGENMNFNPVEEDFFYPIVYETYDGKTDSYQVQFGEYDKYSNTELYSAHKFLIFTYRNNTFRMI